MANLDEKRIFNIEAYVVKAVSGRRQIQAKIVIPTKADKKRVG